MTGRAAPARRRPWEPAGYDYQDHRYCPSCVIERLLDRFELRDCPMSMDEEQCLDSMGAALGIDRYAEHSYDSKDFPKVVLADHLDDTAPKTCCACRRELT